MIKIRKDSFTVRKKKNIYRSEKIKRDFQRSKKKNECDINA